MKAAVFDLVLPAISFGQFSGVIARGGKPERRKR
jgi:hypothetical protein